MRRGAPFGEAFDIPGLRFTVEGRSPAIVTIEGELDLAGAPGLGMALEGLDSDVHVVCSGLTFIDAAGLGVLVRAHRAARARGTKVVLVRPSAPVLRVVGLVGLDRELIIE